MSRVDYPPVGSKHSRIEYKVYHMSTISFPPITSKNSHIEYPSLLPTMQERWLIRNAQRLCRCKRAT